MSKLLFLRASGITPLDRYVDYVAPESSKSGTDLLRTGLERMVDALRNGEKQVVLVEDSPIGASIQCAWPWQEAFPWRDLIFRLAWPNCAGMFRGAVGLDYTVPPDPRSVQIVRDVAVPDGVRYLDLFSRFCDGGQCLFERENDLFFIDTKPFFRAWRHICS